MKRRDFLTAMSATLPLPLIGCNQLLTDKDDGMVLTSIMNLQGFLNVLLPEWEEKLKATIGMTVVNGFTGERASYRGSDRFPFNSTIKAFIVANFLKLADNNQIKLNKSIQIQESDLLSYAPVTKSFFAEGKPMTFEQLCEATMTMSDNTAANLILSEMGGLPVFNEFLASIGMQNTILTDNEPLLNEAKYGDFKNTTQPIEYIDGLMYLYKQAVLSESSHAKWTLWMKQNQVADSLFRKYLPNNWEIFDRTGAGSNGSRNIIALIKNNKKVPYYVSLFFVNTEASFADRNEAIAKIGEALYQKIT